MANSGKDITFAADLMPQESGVYNLGNSTNKWLINGEATSSYAKLASPTFTGTPKAPTAAAGTNTTQIATTAFVTTAVSGKQNTISDLTTIRAGAEAGASALQESDISQILTTGTEIAQIGSVMLYAPTSGGGGAVDSVNGKTGAVVLSSNDIRMGTTTSLGETIDDAIETLNVDKSDTGHTHTVSQVKGLATVATSGSYDDLLEKPTYGNIADMHFQTGTGSISVAASSTSGTATITLSGFSAAPAVIVGHSGNYTNTYAVAFTPYSISSSSFTLKAYVGSSTTAARTFYYRWIAIGK